MPELKSTLTPQQFTRFGELLRFLRECAGLTQRELALEVGYHYSHLSRIEKNERLPDTATLMTRFVPALGLGDKPVWTARLLELASTPSGEMLLLDAEQAALTSGVVEGSSVILPAYVPGVPPPLTPLLGRDRELSDLKSLLARDDVRLITILGTLGVGKTSLATHLASQVGENFTHGAYLVDLSPVAEPGGVLPAIAQTLGIPDLSDATLLVAVTRALQHKEQLLLLDNFEQVIDAAPILSQILRAAPKVKALVTSREALRISGEHEFPLVPLPLPTVFDGEPDAILEFGRMPAIELFVQRARAVQPRFELTPENAPAVLEICRRLDGLPLALELAAARMRILTPQEMLNQFNRRFDWLGPGARDQRAERSTLRGAVEWSYNLLSEPERLLLRRLAVFAGGCTIDAAEAICADANIPPQEIFNLLAQLVDKSLLVTDLSAGAETRYRCLETIRQFGREQLQAAGQLAQAKNHHLAYFASFAETVETHLNGSGLLEWSQRAEHEHNNLRAALDWGLQPEANLEDALRLAAAISLLWVERSYLHEGSARLSDYLARATSPAHETLRSKILYRLAALRSLISDFEQARLYCEESIQISRAAGNTIYQASALSYLGDILANLNELAAARSSLEESIALFQAVGLLQQLNKALTVLGSVLDRQGETERAIATVSEALSIAERIEDIWGVSFALQTLGTIYRLHRRFDDAGQIYERSLGITLQMGDRHAEGLIHNNLAFYYNLKGDFPRSERSAERAYSIFQTLEDRAQIPLPMRLIAYIALHNGNTVRARALAKESLKGNREIGHLAGQLGSLAALALCELADGKVAQAAALGTMARRQQELNQLELLETDSLALQTVLEKAQQTLSPDEFEQARQQGERISLDFGL